MRPRKYSFRRNEEIFLEIISSFLLFVSSFFIPVWAEVFFPSEPWREANVAKAREIGPPGTKKGRF